MGEVLQHVSIVIPTRNRKDELRIAVRSVLKQTVQPELIVLDDASTDGTAKMIQTDFPMVKFVRSEKSKGPTAQRNYGTKIASTA